MLAKFIYLLFLLAVISCGSTATPEPLSEYRRLLDDDPCDRLAPEKCRFEKVPAIVAKADQKGEAILTVDAGLELPSVGVHRKRIIAQYEEISEAPYYREVIPSVRLPTEMNRILEALSLAPAQASTRTFFSFGQAFTRKYLPLLSGTDALGHGASTLNILAELNPDSPLVLVHLSKTIDRSVCKLANGNAGPELAKRFREKAKALKGIAEKHRIKWVNLSLGHDVRSVTENWRNAECEGELPERETIRNFVRLASLFVDELATVRDLTIFQATPYADAALDRFSMLDYPADCKAIGNRIRVGYVPTERYRFSTIDQRNLELLDETEKRIAACADLFVRDGRKGEFDETDYPLRFSALGIGHAEMNISASSFATPLGLSYAHFLVKRGVARETLLRWIRGDANQPLLISPFAAKSFLNQNQNDYLNWYSRKGLK